MTATTQMLTVRTKPRPSRNKAASSPLATALAYLAGVVIVIVTVVPLLYIFIGGFRSRSPHARTFPGNRGGKAAGNG